MSVESVFGSEQSFVIETMVTEDNVIKNVEIKMFNDSTPQKDKIENLSDKLQIGKAKQNKSKSDSPAHDKVLQDAKEDGQYFDSSCVGKETRSATTKEMENSNPVSDYSYPTDSIPEPSFVTLSNSPQEKDTSNTLQTKENQASNFLQPIKPRQKLKQFLIQRHEKEIAKTMEESLSKDETKRTRHDNVATETGFSKGRQQLVEHTETIHMVPGSQTSYETQTPTSYQFGRQSLTGQPNFPNTGFPLSGNNGLSYRTMSNQESSVNKHVFVIPLLNNEKLEHAKVSSLKAIGVNLNVPLKQITLLGIPTKERSGNIPLLNFPHDAVIELDTDKIISIASSQ